jgi:putative hydrolase of the HAD superfamily
VKRVKIWQRIRGVTFDLDDTLYDNVPVLRQAERSVDDWLAANYPLVAERYDAAALRQLRQALAQAEPALRHDITALRKRALAAAAQSVGYGGEVVAEAGFAVFWEARNAVELYDDVLPVLVDLRSRYTLGALTNGNADLTRIGLAPLFDFALHAGAVGASKPQPPMFLEALRRIGGGPEATVHVGDDAVTDVAGARAVGIRTVWVNRRGVSWPGGDPPDAEIRSLRELTEVLARLEGD